MDLPDVLTKKIAEYMVPLEDRKYPKFELCGFDKSKIYLIFKIHISKGIYILNYVKLQVYGYSNIMYSEFIISYLWIFLQIHNKIKPKASLNHFITQYDYFGNLFYDYDNNKLLYRPTPTSVHYGKEQIIYECPITDKLKEMIAKDEKVYQNVLYKNLYQKERHDKLYERSLKQKFNYEIMNVDTMLSLSKEKDDN